MSDMGNITNLATTGNYKAEENSLEVSFDFVIDNNSAKITDIKSGRVINKDGKVLADFSKQHYGGAEPRDRMNYNLEKGYEVDAVTAAVKVLTAFEAKIATGEADLAVK